MRGEHAAAAMEEVQQALATGLPPSAQSNAALLALLALRLGERHELATRLLDAALEDARQEGHATRQGVIHGHRAAIALAQGSLHDAQVEAETGLLLVEKSHFIGLLLVAVAMTAHIERGELDAAADLARTGEALGTANRAHVNDFLTARGRLRIARGQVEDGVADLLWCGQRREARGCTGPPTGRRTRPRRWPRWATNSWPPGSRASS